MFRRLGIVALALAVPAVTGCVDHDSESSGFGSGGSSTTAVGPGGSAGGGSGGGTGGPSGAPISITSVSPSTVHTLGHTPITITGAGFVTAGTVTVGGQPLQSWTVLSSTTIVGRVPSGPAGPAPVTVTPFTGVSATLAGAVNYSSTGSVPAPTLVAPGSGLSTGGARITITGTNFSPAVQVAFGAISVTPLRTGPTFIEVVAPAAPVVYPSLVDLVVVNPGGASALLSYAFTWRDRPVSADVVTPTMGAPAWADVLGDVADNGSGALHAVWEKQDLVNGNVQVFYRRSLDGGKTWSMPVPVSITSPAGRPRVAASGNHVAVVWEERRGAGLWDVRAAHSTNAGQSFGTRTLLESGVTAPPGPAITSLGGGTVAAAWASTPPSSSGNAPRVRCAVASSGGPFGTAATVASAVSPATPAIDGAGATSLMVAWSDTPAGASAPEVFAARSINTGGTFGTPANLSNYPGAASTVPDVLYDGAAACVVWQQSVGPGASEIMGAASTNSGGTFGAAATISIGTNVDVRTDPVVAEAPNGVWLLAYADGSSAISKRIKVRHTTNGGRHWSSWSVRSATTTGDTPRMSDGARPFTFWRDVKSGRPHIYGW